MKGIDNDPDGMSEAEAREYAHAVSGITFSREPDRADDEKELWFEDLVEQFAIAIAPAMWAEAPIKESDEAFAGRVWTAALALARGRPA